MRVKKAKKKTEKKRKTDKKKPTSNPWLLLAPPPHPRHIYPSIKEPGITEMGYDCGGRADDRWAALSRHGAGVLGVNGKKRCARK